jgi:alpha-glucuronidase
MKTTNQIHGLESGAADIGYWVGLTNHYGQYSDGICRAGWNRYMEKRQQGIEDDVSAADGDSPAIGPTVIPEGG